MRRINFGCGGNILEGWDNYDKEQADITKPFLGIDSNSVDEILAEHVIEHTAGPEALRFLDECRRILKPQGKLWISIPVLDHLDFEHARDIVLGHGHLVPYMHDTVETMLRLAGFTNYHRVLRHVDTDIFGHWRVIGEAKDTLESSRWLAIK